MTKFAVEIQEDDCEFGRYSVAVVVDGRRHFVPARGLTKEEAEAMQRPIMWAFVYGWDACAALEH